jgi:dCMP deaminase
MKRENYIKWDEYFMGVALLSAMRSKDPGTQVGACIVNEKKRIVGIGYNGFPIGVQDDKFPWNNDGEWLDNKYPYVVHAEPNAILNATVPLDGSTLYVTLFPCNECAKLIIQSGIKHIVYLEDKYHDNKEFVASRKMLNAAGVTYRKLANMEVTLTSDKWTTE